MMNFRKVLKKKMIWNKNYLKKSYHLNKKSKRKNKIPIIIKNKNNNIIWK